MNFAMFEMRNANIETNLVTFYNNLHLSGKQWHPQEIQILCQNNPMYLDMYLSIMAETRDIEYGKGERESTYELFEQWLQINPTQAIQVISNIIPNYGCWKDVKYMCQRIHNKFPNHPMIASLLQMLNNALFQCHENKKATAYKWVPREKSAFRQFYHYLAVDWNVRILRKPETVPVKSMYKCYRQSLALIKARKPWMDRKPPTSYQSIIEKSISKKNKL